jgi:hypothetical protein
MILTVLEDAVAEGAQDELTQSQRDTLIRGEVYAPGPYRGADEHRDLWVYPGAPKTPTRPATMPGYFNRSRVMEDMRKGRLLLLTWDLGGIVTRPEALTRETTTEADLLKLFVFVDPIRCFGGPDFDPTDENWTQYCWRQNNRVIQDRAFDLKTSSLQTARLRGIVSGSEKVSVLVETQLRYQRYILLHKLLIPMEISSETNALEDVMRPYPRCFDCVLVDPRTRLYCDQCYEKLDILL